MTPEQAPAIMEAIAWFTISLSVSAFFLTLSWIMVQIYFKATEAKTAFDDLEHASLRRKQRKEINK